MSEQPDWADKKAREIVEIAMWNSNQEAQGLIAFHLRIIRQEGIAEGLAIAEHAITNPADAADSDAEPS